MRRIELGYGLSITGELAGTVALVVYALGAGGAPLVAAYAASRTVAGMAVALVLTALTSRRRRFVARGNLPPAPGCRFALAGAHAGRARRVQCRHRRDRKLRRPGRPA